MAGIIIKLAGGFVRNLLFQTTSYITHLTSYIIMISLSTETEAIVKHICAVSQPDAIYLLATLDMKRRITSIFTGSAPSCHYTAHYLLLVLESSGLKTHDVGERIENACKPFTPVTVIVVKTKDFTAWIAESHPFALTTLSRGAGLYTAGTLSLPAVAPLPKGAKQERGRSLCHTNGKRIAAFLAGADLFRLRTEYGMAAFMLHQAAECSLRTAVHATTGYYCNTHNLDRLFRLASFSLWRLPEIFGRYRAGSEALFSLLQKAYVEPRYKDDYKISLTDLDALFTKMQELREHLKEVIMNSLLEV